MHLNALAAAVRHLRKHARFAGFNIFGISIAFLAFFFISLYVFHELHYDDYNINRHNIYRVESRLKIGNEVTDYAIAPPVIGANIQNRIPSVVAACRLFPQHNLRFRLRDEQLIENNVAYADADVFKVFTLPLLNGSSSSLLSEPNTVVLSEHAAMKYFGRADIAGEQVTIFENDNMHSLTVSAVMKDIPEQSHFHFDFLISMVSMPIHANTNFLSFYPTGTYVLFTPHVDINKTTAAVNAWVRSSIPDYNEIQKGGNEISMILTPLKNIHLQSDKKYELGKNGNRQYIYIFSTGAIFILVMAGINFMNLSLSRFTKRSKEAAVKKVLGSSAHNLSLQFIFESVLLCFFSIVIAVSAGILLLPFFNGTTGLSLTLSGILHSWIIPGMIITCIVIGLASGIYPAFLLSSVRPTAIMSGRSIATGRHPSFSLQHALLVVQFVVSAFLISGTIIVYRQLSFIHNKPTGYDRGQLLVVRNAAALENTEILKEKVLKLPGVVSVTLSDYLPTNDTRWSNFGGTRTSESPVQAEFWPVDEDYIPTLGITMQKGRNFEKLRVTDSSAVILNEAAYEMFGLGEKIFNEEVSFSYRQQPKAFHVIGVVKNFHFNSFRQSIGPLVFVLSDRSRSGLVVRSRGNAERALLSEIGNAWKSLGAKEKMDVSFIDDDFNVIYKDDNLMAKLFMIFAILAIFIASLGLLSFIANTISTRKKEIAIRTILGATKGSTALLVAKNYLIMIIVSVCIALPLAGFVMARWLEGFAYRYQVHYTDFLLAASLSLVIAIATMSAKAFSFSTKRLIDNIKAT